MAYTSEWTTQRIDERVCFHGSPISGVFEAPYVETWLLAHGYSNFGGLHQVDYTTVQECFVKNIKENPSANCRILNAANLYALAGLKIMGSPEFPGALDYIMKKNIGEVWYRNKSGVIQSVKMSELWQCIFQTGVFEGISAPPEGLAKISAFQQKSSDRASVGAGQQQQVLASSNPSQQPPVFSSTGVATTALPSGFVSFTRYGYTGIFSPEYIQTWQMANGPNKQEAERQFIAILQQRAANPSAQNNNSPSNSKLIYALCGLKLLGSTQYDAALQYCLTLPGTFQCGHGGCGIDTHAMSDLNKALLMHYPNASSYLCPLNFEQQQAKQNLETAPSPLQQPHEQQGAALKCPKGHPLCLWGHYRAWGCDSCRRLFGASVESKMYSSRCDVCDYDICPYCANPAIPRPS